MHFDDVNLSFSADGETFTSVSKATTADITFEKLREIAKLMPPPPPRPNEHQCKICGAIIGKHFGGLIDIAQIAVTAGVGPFAPIVAFLCPPCSVEFQQRLNEAGAKSTK